MDCTDCVTFWEITGALSIGIMSGFSLVWLLTYYFDYKRDEMILMLQQAWAERNELRKKLQNNE
tara:strand:+ start:338 stop:529 length:192 start_codon:yes stop_codon:yes gene_type:complete